MRSFKYILFFLLLFNLVVHAQKDSVKWHFGAKLNYSSVFYPERKPVVFYKYSQSYGIGLFFEKTLRKNPKLNFGGALNYEILYLTETLPILDTSNIKYDQATNTISYRNYNNITLKYSIYSLSFFVNRKLSSRYTLGIGIKGIYFNLKEKTGVHPFTWQTSVTCTPTCRYYYATLDYTLDDFGFLPFLTIKNKFKLFKRNYLSLDLDIATLGFNHYYNMKKWQNSSDRIYTGINWEAINYVSFNYIFYFR